MSECVRVEKKCFWKSFPSKIATPMGRIYHYTTDPDIRLETRPTLPELLAVYTTLGAMNQALCFHKRCPFTSYIYPGMNTQIWIEHVP